MNKSKHELAKLLHDFKAPLASGNMGIQFILDGRAGKIGKQAAEMLMGILKRNQALLKKIAAFEEKYG